MSGDRSSVAGLWNACSQMEQAASRRITEQLDAFRPPLVCCYEAGVSVPTIPGDRQGEKDLIVAGPFLKRALTDLRSVWVLLISGYTSQAGSVAAALFEHALTVSALAGSPERADELLESPTGDVPWGAKQLCKLEAQSRSLWKDAGEEGEKLQYERLWRSLYGSYIYLCKVKHPTFRSTLHDIGATEHDRGTYSVMAAPDTREEDVAHKATILVECVSRCLQATRAFALALECDEETPEYQKFEDRMNKVIDPLMRAYKEVTEQGKLPFGIEDHSVHQELEELGPESEDE